MITYCIEKKYMQNTPKRYIGLSYGVDKYTKAGPLEANVGVGVFVDETLILFDTLDS